MRINIDGPLPEKISDEAAYHLVNFFMSITAELESIYFAKMRRYIEDNKPIKPKRSLKALAF
jgi:hypothetical protein